MNHIAPGTLALCDGLKSYNVLVKTADYTAKDCNTSTEKEKRFYHLYTVNGFHYIIKQQYNFYQGVATKYLNKYNALSSTAYRNADCLIAKLTGLL